MDGAELWRMEAVARELHEERHSWCRHQIATKWCAVLEYDGGSVVTRCDGRFPRSDVHDLAGRPPFDLRCELCQERFAAAQAEKLTDICECTSVGTHEGFCPARVSYSPMQRAETLDEVDP